MFQCFCKAERNEKGSRKEGLRKCLFFHLSSLNESPDLRRRLCGSEMLIYLTFSFRLEKERVIEQLSSEILIKCFDFFFGSILNFGKKVIGKLQRVSNIFNLINKQRRL